MPIDWIAPALAVLGIVIGGILKGATGAGAPIVAVPMLAVVFDVPAAVTIFVIPNLASNIWQGWAYRGARMPGAFTAVFAGAGLAGAALGTVMLAELPPRALSLATALVVLIYVGFRVMRPGWALGMAAGQRLAAPIGFVGGILQGAVGVSAPVSVTFLNALRLERSTFIATISIFFLAMTAVQAPLMLALGLMTLERAAWGVGALAILAASMPAGAALARRISRETFDRVILALLSAIAVRLIWQVVSG